MNEKGADPGEQLTRLLTELANDPDAPPSTVTAGSVLAAAKAAGAGFEEAGSTHDSAAAASGDSDSSQVVTPERDELAARRARRRRTGLAALVAAAAVAAIAAVVIPLTLSSESSTSTAAREAPTVQPFAQSAEAAPGAAVDTAAPPSAAAALTAPRVPAVPGITNPAMSSGQAGAADAEAAGSAAGGSAPASVCWPALPDAVVQALVAALPPDAFGSPEPLTTGCVPDPVGGAVLPGLAGSEVPTALTVQVQKADPGACRQSPAAAGRCAAATDGVYLRSGAAGPSAFVYGGGKAVQVGGSTTASGASIGTGLTAQQLAAAARAVLAAL